jgi:hypothetical protein
MASPRRCGTCRHHVPGAAHCSGHCAHPARQAGSGVAVLVRTAELACRTSWGTDLWEPQPAHFSIELRIWGPFTGDELQPDDLPVELLNLLMDLDDQAQ